jgi:hypothetical protein
MQARWTLFFVQESVAFVTAIEPLDATLAQTLTTIGLIANLHPRSKSGRIVRRMAP